ncbi:SDR family NAD(P)-dependent oxidoreductase [Nonomuraea sp. K274]|uniref:SDR family NAD(P)-dependent oxidoreductase n=1 Tax=Nonomuraea cypriaca TaxID=1187855 RepID=A0A931AD78_9ACTN|nr:oxidoreductase [Nonomuraea cypriaca]MBF8189748.1 SDR family NAD(P)-dependent oxidoreductase [Nonomuraea cypriaca]
MTDVPSQEGRVALVTGANSGLGRHTAMALAARGARVLLACRDPGKAEAAAREIASLTGGAAEPVRLDLADLGSVRAAAAEAMDRAGGTLHILVNNAGIMANPHRVSADGHELQLATNHLGHAALTWLLMPALRASPGARVVTVSSGAHRGPGLDVADLDFERRPYDKWAAYNQSKLANLLFAFELDRRARAAGLDLVSAAAHPGMARTGLFTSSARAQGGRALVALTTIIARVACQPAAKGALPQLHAATMPGVQGGEYFGPGGFAETRGRPVLAECAPAARDEHLAARLWKETARLTGVIPAPA